MSAQNVFDIMNQSITDLQGLSNLIDDETALKIVDHVADELFRALALCDKPKRARAKPAAVKEPAPNVWAEWCDANKRAGRAYPLPVPKNLGAARELAKAVSDVAARAVLFDRYLSDRNPFIAGQGWPLCLLPGRADAYRNAPVLALKPRNEWTDEDYEQEFLDKARADALKKAGVK